MPSDYTTTCFLDLFLQDFILDYYRKLYPSNVKDRFILLSQKDSVLTPMIKEHLRIRPVNAPFFPSGENPEMMHFRLPYFADKNVCSWNYLYPSSQRVIKKGLMEFFFARFYRHMDQYDDSKIYQLDFIYLFLEQHHIDLDHIKTDRLVKRYQRHQKKLRSFV